MFREQTQSTHTHITGITTAIEAFKRGDKEGLGVRSERKVKEPSAKEEKKEAKKKKKVKRESNWKIELDDAPTKKPKKLYKTSQEIR
jgi:hypothetical protein